jgi:hypothetical protein
MKSNETGLSSILRGQRYSQVSARVTKIKNKDTEKLSAIIL